MIVFVSTHGCRGSHKDVECWKGTPRVRRRSYWPLFHARSLPVATYILTDFDRLSPWELELAANLYLELKAGGARVLNDPRSFRPRYMLLNHLHAQGLNSVHCWSPALGEVPDRFPVFLRTQAAHRGTLSDLLHDVLETNDALNAALRDGYALNDLMFTEFLAEPLPEGLFRKHAAFRVGGHMLPALSVFTEAWMGKISDNDRVPLALHDKEHDELETLPHADHLLRVFEAANIDYGRIDYGIVDGKVVTYEINTNPWMGNVTPGRDGYRPATKAIVQQRYIEALYEIDCAQPGRIRLNAPALVNQRKEDGKWLWTRRWTP